MEGHEKAPASSVHTHTPKGQKDHKEHARDPRVDADLHGVQCRIRNQQYHADGNHRICVPEGGDKAAGAEGKGRINKVVDWGPSTACAPISATFNQRARKRANIRRRALQK